MTSTAVFVIIVVKFFSRLNLQEILGGRGGGGGGGLPVLVTHLHKMCGSLWTPEATERVEEEEALITIHCILSVRVVKPLKQVNCHTNISRIKSWLCETLIKNPG